MHKLHEYQRIPSVRRSVILEQGRMGATVMERGEHGWTSCVIERGGMLHMPEIGVDVPLDELYEGVDFTYPEV